MSRRDVQAINICESVGINKFYKTPPNLAENVFMEGKKEANFEPKTKQSLVISDRGL